MQRAENEHAAQIVVAQQIGDAPRGRAGGLRARARQRQPVAGDRDDCREGQKREDEERVTVSHPVDGYAGRQRTHERGHRERKGEQTEI